MNNKMTITETSFWQQMSIIWVRSKGYAAAISLIFYTELLCS